MNIDINASTDYVNSVFIFFVVPNPLLGFFAFPPILPPAEAVSDVNLFLLPVFPPSEDTLLRSSGDSLANPVLFCNSMFHVTFVNLDDG